MDTREFNEIIAANSSWISALRTEVGKVVIGQQALVDRLILSLLCKGHVLLEGVPGLAKTLSVKAMAGTLHAQFARIQFTPDLLPADLLGTMIYNPEKKGSSQPKKARSSPISFWRMKSTAPRPKCNPPCWKPCRNAR